MHRTQGRFVRPVIVHTREVVVALFQCGGEDRHEPVGRIDHHRAAPRAHGAAVIGPVFRRIHVRQPAAGTAGLERGLVEVHPQPLDVGLSVRRAGRQVGSCGRHRLHRGRLMVDRALRALAGVDRRHGQGRYGRRREQNTGHAHHGRGYWRRHAAADRIRVGGEVAAGENLPDMCLRRVLPDGRKSRAIVGLPSGGKALDGRLIPRFGYAGMFASLPLVELPAAMIDSRPSAIQNPWPPR